MNTRWIIFSLLSLTLPLRAGWVLHLPAQPTSPARVMYYAQPDKGDASFADALKELSKEVSIQTLDGIVAYQLLQEAAFQKELLAAFEQGWPREMKEARNSAGNMHNPKMVQLRTHLSEAVLATPTVREMNAALQPYGLKICRASAEEFMFLKPKNETDRRLNGSLWLTVAKLRLKS